MALSLRTASLATISKTITTTAAAPTVTVGPTVLAPLQPVSSGTPTTATATTSTIASRQLVTSTGTTSTPIVLDTNPTTLDIVPSTGVAPISVPNAVTTETTTSKIVPSYTATIPSYENTTTYTPKLNSTTLQANTAASKMAEVAADIASGSGAEKSTFDAFSQNNAYTDVTTVAADANTTKQDKYIQTYSYDTTSTDDSSVDANDYFTKLYSDYSDKTSTTSTDSTDTTNTDNTNSVDAGTRVVADDDTTSTDDSSVDANDYFTKLYSDYSDKTSTTSTDSTDTTNTDNTNSVDAGTRVVADEDTYTTESELPAKLPETPPTTPFYKKWWFWAGVGVVTVGAVGGVYYYKRSRKGY